MPNLTICAHVPAHRVCSQAVSRPPERQTDGMSPARYTLWPAAHCFRRGHRLRLQVSSGAHSHEAPQ
jgi:predicted acyl esterase